MDSLKTLMDKRQYELVVKLTKNSEDANSLFYRISAFVGLNKPLEALEVVESKQDILQENLSILIKIHVEILCILERYEDAFKALEHYQNMPYVSQEVEETLKEMPKIIRKIEKDHFSYRNFDDDKIIDLLTSKEKDDVLLGLDLIRNRDPNAYITYVSRIMERFPNQSIRSFALLTLVKCKYNKQLSFKHDEEIISVNPSLLEPPFVGQDFNKLNIFLTNEFKNPVMSDTAMQLYSSHLIYIYPYRVDDSLDVIFEALNEITSAYLKADIKIPLEERCKARNIDANRVKKLIEEINYSLEKA